MVRPVKWENAEDMKVAIDAYFNDIEEHNLNNENKKHPTVTGLALALDLTREGLMFYINKNEPFADTIKKAKARVEEYIEQRLYYPNATGCIFNLKNNFGWEDQSVVNNNVAMMPSIKLGDKELEFDVGN
jgi:hypothetical protein